MSYQTAAFLLTSEFIFGVFRMDPSYQHSGKTKREGGDDGREIQEFRFGESLMGNLPLTKLASSSFVCLLPHAISGHITLNYSI